MYAWDICIYMHGIYVYVCTGYIYIYAWDICICMHGIYVNVHTYTHTYVRTYTHMHKIYTYACRDGK